MSRDFLNELANKLSQSSSGQANFDLKETITKLSSADNSIKQATLSDLRTQAQNFETNKKYKEAAYQFYIGGMIARHFYPSDSKSFTSWFQSSSRCLVGLAQEYLGWKEIDRAAAAISLATLVNFLADDQWVLPDYYNQFLNSYSSLIQTGKTASGSLWVPNYLISAIHDLNAEALQQSDNFAQNYLLAEAKTTSQYRDGINLAINLARKKISTSIKTPDMKLTAHLPKDVLFAEKFKISVEITNSGEGEAKNTQVVFNTPVGVNLVSGTEESIFGNFSNNTVKKLEYEFVCPASQGINEKLFDFSGQVQYDDILGNRRSKVIGPYSLTIRAFRKADQLRDELKKVQASLEPELTKLNSQRTTANITNLVNTLSNLINGIIKDINTGIDAGSYDSVQVKLDILKSLSSQLLVPESEFIANFTEIMNKITTSAQESQSILQDSKRLLEKLNAKSVHLKEVLTTK